MRIGKDGDFFQRGDFFAGQRIKFPDFIYLISE